VKHAAYITALVVVGTFVVTWTAGRVIARIRGPMAVVNAVAVRVCVGVIFVLMAAAAATHGGFWLAAVPCFGVLALWDFVLTAGVIWAWARGKQFDEHDATS
jgi:hypothetical protein